MKDQQTYRQLSFDLYNAYFEAKNKAEFAKDLMLTSDVVDFFNELLKIEDSIPPNLFKVIKKMIYFENDIFIDKSLPLSEQARLFAIKHHRNVNQFYSDDIPYEYHLYEAVKFGKKFLNLIPEHMHEIVLAGIWVHDLTEDARLTFNDIKNELGESVAMLAFALQNEKGINRNARANDKYYNDIINVEYATFVKLCDRAANIKYSLLKKSSMFKTYKKEHDNFLTKLKLDSNHEYWPLVEKINSKYLSKSI